MPSAFGLAHGRLITGFGAGAGIGAAAGGGVTDPVMSSFWNAEAGSGAGFMAGASTGCCAASFGAGLCADVPPARIVQTPPAIPNATNATATPTAMRIPTLRNFLTNPRINGHSLRFSQTTETIR
jgi:hypothetical protein